MGPGLSRVEAQTHWLAPALRNGAALSAVLLLARQDPPETSYQAPRGLAFSSDLVIHDDVLRVSGFALLVDSQGSHTVLPSNVADRQLAGHRIFTPCFDVSFGSGTATLDEHYDFGSASVGAHAVGLQIWPASFLHARSLLADSAFGSSSPRCKGLVGCRHSTWGFEHVSILVQFSMHQPHAISRAGASGKKRRDQVVAVCLPVLSCVLSSLKWVWPTLFSH